MATYKERMSLLGKYKKLHLQRYEEVPTHNLNAEQWTAENLVESYGLHVCYDMLEYYFEAYDSPSWKHFGFKAERVFDSMRGYKKDLEERQQRMKMAKEWLNG
tara:strand:- start:379 stop:687 length:309 start_codon:yes stop_codon:yes gene_type:complete